MYSGKKLKAWQKKCIKKILDIENTNLSVVIEDARNEDWRERIGNLRPNQLLFQIYYRLLMKTEATKEVDGEDLFDGAEKVRINNIETDGFSEYFPDEKINEIKSHNLDFILRFAFGIIRGDILESSKYGVWSFHHDDERKYRGGPPCFWEVYYGDEKTGYVLQRLTERLDGGIVLKREFEETDKASYSSNLNNVFWESANIPSDVCEKIIYDEEYTFPGEVSSTEAPIFSYPTNREFLIFMYKMIIRRVRDMLND